MESQTQSQTRTQTLSQSQTERQQQRRGPMKKSSSRNSESSNLDSPHSPLRFHSPLQSDVGDPTESPPYESPADSPEHPLDNSRAIVAVEKANSLNRHEKANSLNRHEKPQPQATAPRQNSPAKPPPPPMIVNRAVREDAPPSVAKVGPSAGDYANGADGRRSNHSSPGAGRRPGKTEALKSAALGFRVLEFVLCLISFSVMAADKTQGWSGDSFDRYKEYRYCLCVNVIAFVFSLFQAYDLSYYLVTGKHVIKHHLRRHFELFMDQVLAYLLISAASSAATRVDDWQSNWGKDEFTKMASASVVMAFLAFAAFAISTLISGYNLWTENSV